METTEHWRTAAERAEGLATGGDRAACAVEAARIRDGLDHLTPRRRYELILSRLDAAAEGVWWNSRYLAYCRAMGTPDPHERRALDEAKYPDAPFLLAIFWVDERWREWEKLNRLSLWEAPRSRADHEAFDRWLEARTH